MQRCRRLTRQELKLACELRRSDVRRKKRLELMEESQERERDRGETEMARLVAGGTTGIETSEPQ